MNRVAFFSQTGTEILNLILLGHKPKFIITNKSIEKHERTTNKELISVCEDLDIPFAFIPNNPTLEDYRAVLKNTDVTLITLHGYLRILPKEICEEYTIINLHPGYITQYPELKGKDPQKRAWEGDYDCYGCVLHECIAEVDAGEIVETGCIVANEVGSYDDLLHELSEIALDLWDDYLSIY